MRVAIVDIGTNSTRLLIAETERGRVVEQLDRQTNVTRLGAGVDADGRLRDDAMARVFDVLDDYRRRIDAARAGSAHAVLTSAVRDAANGSGFAEQVHDRYGLEAHVLSGEEEARLTYLGATGERAGAERTLVIDIGGGSTELVIGSGPDVELHVSTQAGVVRQSERHIHHDPPTESELAAVASDVRGIFESAVPRAGRGFVALGIAVAGTPTSLAAIAQRLDPYDPTRTHGYVLTAGERDAILAELWTMPLAQRQAVPGLHPARALVIVPGLVILREAMELFGVRSVEVSEHDILRGAAVAYGGG